MFRLELEKENIRKRWYVSSQAPDVQERNVQYHVGRQERYDDSALVAAPTFSSFLNHQQYEEPTF
jgi:hypothetical protein